MRLIFFSWFITAFSFVHLIAQDSTSLLQFESETIDIGEVKKGELKESQFVFTNVSSTDVNIEFVSTCICTEAIWPSKSFKPGETGTIDFVFDSTKKDDEEPVELDVILSNLNKNGDPEMIYLSYSFTFAGQ